MVDALCESGRVLSEGGLLLDLRPRSAEPCPVEIVAREQVVVVGALDASAAAVDDVAADRAVEQVVRRGLYVPRGEARFDLEFVCDNAGELAEFAQDSRRRNVVTPSYPRVAEILSTWRAEEAGRVRLRCTRPMQLGVYRRVGERPARAPVEVGTRS